MKFKAGRASQAEIYRSTTQEAIPSSKRNNEEMSESLDSLSREYQEILDDDYLSSKRFYFTSTNEDKINVTVEGELAQKGTTAAVSIQNKGNYMIDLDRLRVKSDGRILLEASLKANDNLKFFMAAEDGKQEPGRPLQSFGKIGSEILFNNTNFNIDIDVVNGPLIKGSLMQSYNTIGKWKFGGEAIINTKFDENKASRPELVNLSIGGLFKQPSYSVHFRTIENFSAFRLCYLHKLTPIITVSTMIDLNYKLNQQKMIFGGVYKLDNNTTFKGKVDSNAIISGSFQHKINPFVKLTMSAEVDAQGWSSVENHKSGISLSFNN